MHKILFILFCLLSLSVKAEKEINANIKAIVGVIVDASDGNPLPGATIWIEGSTIGAVTNSSGEFKLIIREDILPTLNISFMGYTPEKYKLELDNQENIVISLRVAQNSLEEVVVTGTRTFKPLKDVPVLTRVVSQQDIKRINPMDIQTLLEYEVPGLQFGRAHGSNLPAITFQGVDGAYVLFLLNGERMAGEGSSNNIDFTRINIDEIERIEVVRGAMSTLYGSSAMGGVINIITKNADRPFVARLNSRYNSYGAHKQSMSVGTRKNSFSALSSLGYRTEDAYNVVDNDGGIASMAGYEIWNFSQRIGYSFTDKLKVEIDGSYYRNGQLELNQSAKKQEVFVGYTVNPRLKWFVKEENFINVSYLLDNYVKKLEYKTIDSDKIYDDLKHTMRIEYVGVFADKHTLTVGAELNTEKLLHYRLQDSGYRKTQNYVVFLQEDWRVSDNFNVVAGVRVDCHSDFGENPSPKLSLMYRLGDFTFRGGYAMGFRLPSLRERFEEYDMGGLGAFTIHGNDNLITEKSHQASLSAELTKGIFNVSASTYYNRFFDKIAMRLLNDGTSDQQYFNADHATTAGVDLTAQMRLDFGLTMKTSYSFVKDYEESEGYNTSSVRPHSMTFNALYTRKIGKVRANAAFNGRWISGVDAWFKDDGFEKTSYNSRTICSMNLSGQFPRGFNLGFQIDNLFDFEDKKISSDASLTPERGISFSGTLGINISELFKL